MIVVMTTNTARYEGRFWNGTKWVKFVRADRYEYVLDSLRFRTRLTQAAIRIYDHDHKKIVLDRAAGC
jgi:hypothetical protein